MALLYRDSGRLSLVNRFNLLSTRCVDSGQHEISAHNSYTVTNVFHAVYYYFMFMLMALQTSFWSLTSSVIFYMLTRLGGQMFSTNIKE